MPPPASSTCPSRLPVTVFHERVRQSGQTPVETGDSSQATHAVVSATTTPAVVLTLFPAGSCHRTPLTRVRTGRPKEGQRAGRGPTVFLGRPTLSGRSPCFAHASSGPRACRPQGEPRRRTAEYGRNPADLVRFAHLTRAFPCRGCAGAWAGRVHQGPPYATHFAQRCITRSQLRSFDSADG